MNIEILFENGMKLPRNSLIKRQQPGSKSERTPEWLLALGGILGVVIATVAVQRLFPRQVTYIQKNERKQN